MMAGVIRKKVGQAINYIAVTQIHLTIYSKSFPASVAS